MVKKVLKTPLSSTLFRGSSSMKAGPAETLLLGLPMNPSVNSEGAAVDEMNWQVLSTSQELFSLAKSLGPRMFVRVIILLITSSLDLTLVVDALKKVVK